MLSAKPSRLCHHLNQPVTLLLSHLKYFLLSAVVTWHVSGKKTNIIHGKWTCVSMVLFQSAVHSVCLTTLVTFMAVAAIKLLIRSNLLSSIWLTDTLTWQPEEPGIRTCNILITRQPALPPPCLHLSYTPHPMVQHIIYSRHSSPSWFNWIRHK